jgi:hypothetical protein
LIEIFLESDPASSGNHNRIEFRIDDFEFLQNQGFHVVLYVWVFEREEVDFRDVGRLAIQNRLVYVVCGEGNEERIFGAWFEHF